MELPKIFSEALALPNGTYYTPKLARIRVNEVMLVGMDGTAITNSQSTIPVIGTDAFSPCCTLILYNTKTKTGILTHKVDPNGSEFSPMLDKIRTDPTEQVEVHIMGNSFYTARDDDDFEGLNDDTIITATSFLETLAKTKNVILKTFDVYNKPKPNAVLLDTRTGNLIRGSKLFVTMGEGDKCRSHFDSYDTLPEGEDLFDGTVRELQKQKRR